MFNLRKSKFIKTARYGQDSGQLDELDQLLPNWNPYGNKRKSPNELTDTKVKPFDISKEGPNNGLARSPKDDGIDRLYEGLKETTLLDQHDDGSLDSSQSGRGDEFDMVSDSPQSYGSDDGELSNSPLGENARVLEKVRQNRNEIKDNHPDRLTGNRLHVRPKPFNEKRRSNKRAGPLSVARKERLSN
jgi:hypothetical protein